jgi:tetratricopeptide (TPR) repeat protein
MLQARNTGKLDYFGELSLGEVAASTKHWDVANQAFTRIDATNLLINRADKLLHAHNMAQAIQEYLLAKQSLDAAYKRSSAKALLLDRTGQKDSSYGSLTQQPGEKVTFLYKIGHGILNAGDAERAIPILDEALQSAQSHSPGILLKQSIYFNLAQALASSVSQSVGLGPRSSAASSNYFMVDSSQYATIDTICRTRALTYVGLKLSVTAESSFQAGSILLMIGDDIDGVLLIQQALDLNPHFKDAYLVLAKRDADVGMPVTAREVYKKASELLPSDSDLLNKYLIACRQTMAPQQVLPILEKAMTSRARNDQLYAMMADCYTDLKLTSDARAALEEGLKAYPDSQALASQLQTLERQTRN